MIGHLPNEESAQRFSDFLVVEGIVNEVEPDQGKWAIWIHVEDEVDKAKSFLDAYQKSPGDPRFRHYARQARLKREQETKEQEEAERRQIDGRRVFRQGGAQAGAFTFVLIAISVGVALYSNFGKDTNALRALLISEEFGKHLPEVRRGEVWRLFSPVFIHFGLPHLVFNMMSLYVLGGMIEHVRGATRLAWLVAVIGILSNVGQYFYAGPAFGGMSGVVYGLFGYIWMKATLDPWSGLFVHPQTVVMLMAWFFLCMSPWVPFQAANMAHAVGLIIGVVWGVISGAWRRM
jgi:GlpG protein